MRPSLSSLLSCVKPICMGSVPGGTVAVTAGARGGRCGRRERRRLSRRIARLMNCSRVLTSSRQARSDCSLGLRPLRKRRLRGSASLHPVCAASFEALNEAGERGENGVIIIPHSSGPFQRAFG